MCRERLLDVKGLAAGIPVLLGADDEVKLHLFLSDRLHNPSSNRSPSFTPVSPSDFSPFFSPRFVCLHAKTGWIYKDPFCWMMRPSQPRIASSALYSNGSLNMYMPML